MNAPPPIASVPPDILAIVFRYCVLQPRPLAFRTLALVARRWHEAVWRFFIATRNLRLTSLGEEQIDRSWGFLARVTSLEVSSASPALLEQLSCVAPKLATLRFWRGGVSVAAVDQLRLLPSLRHLRWYVVVSFAGVRSMLTGGPCDAQRVLPEPKVSPGPTRARVHGRLIIVVAQVARGRRGVAE